MCPERRNPAFSEERIEQAILGNLEQIEAGKESAFTPKPKPQPYRPHPKYAGFLALYFHYCYLLGRIEKRQYPPHMSPHLRKEIMKADIYKARLKFLQEQNICTPDDLASCIQNIEQKIAKLSKQRTVLNVRKKKRKTLYDALAAEAAFAGFEPRKAEYDDAKEVLDTCGIPREVLLAEKSALLSRRRRTHPPQGAAVRKAGLYRPCSVHCVFCGDPRFEIGVPEFLRGITSPSRLSPCHLP